MKKRVITAMFLVLILVPLIVIEHNITKILFAILTCVLSGIGSYEIINTMYLESPELKRYRILVPILSSLLCGLTLLATYMTSLDIVTIKENFVYHFFVLVFFMFSLCLVFGLMIFTKNSEARAIMGCILALTYSGLLFGYVFSLRYFKPVVLNCDLINLNGLKSFAYVYSIVFATDTFAYFLGIKFGKTKLCPTISPKKSVFGAYAGFVAGIIFGVAVAFLLGIVKTTSLKDTLLAILVVAVISGFISIVVQLGDLIESKLKRSFNVKDFGNIFPGHGGVLDRFDSFIYAGTWFYIIIQIIQLIMLGV